MNKFNFNETGVIKINGFSVGIKNKHQVHLVLMRYGILSYVTTDKSFVHIFLLNKWPIIYEHILYVIPSNGMILTKKRLINFDIYTKVGQFYSNNILFLLR